MSERSSKIGVFSFQMKSRTVGASLGPFAKRDEMVISSILILAYLVDRLNHNLASGQYGSCFEERGLLARELAYLCYRLHLLEFWWSEAGALNFFFLYYDCGDFQEIFSEEVGPLQKMDLISKYVFLHFLA